MANRVVIVTGANSGIGLHMTLALLEAGYRVAGFDLTGEEILNSAGGSELLRFLRCDVADEEAVASAVAAVVSEWKRIDILVNNACLAIFSRFEDKSVEDTRREFDVNFFGYVNMIRAVLPRMKAQSSGVIHNVGSTVGITGFPGIYGYASAKGAIEALTRTLAIELRPFGITVNLMHPTLTRTKSAAPLGIPAQAMADPAVVGRGLARRIGSRKAIVTANLTTRTGVFLSRHFPERMGTLMARMSARAKKP